MHSHQPMETNAASTPNEGRHGRSTAPKTRCRRARGALRALGMAVLAFAAIFTGLLTEGTTSAQTVNDNGSETIYASTLTMAAPSAPLNLGAKAISSTQIDLEWEAPAMTGGPAITGYKIEVSTDGGNNWSDHVADTTSTDTTYSHTGLMSGDTRHYRVSAINSDGTGPESNTASATIAVPSAPSSLKAGSGPLNGEATVFWNAASDNGSNSITKYQVRHQQGSSVSSSATWTDVADGAVARNYTVSGLSKGVQYSFEVRAVNGVGSGPSDTATATTRDIDFWLFVTNYSIKRGSNIKGERKTGVYVFAVGTAVETDTTFTLTWNGLPTDELHPDNPTEITINAGSNYGWILLAAAADADEPKVYNQPVNGDVVATLRSLTLTDDLIVIDDETLPVVSLSAPATVDEGDTFRVTATLDHRLDVGTTIPVFMHNPSNMSVTGSYGSISILAGQLTGQTGHLRKQEDSDEDGWGVLRFGVNGVNFSQWWPSSIDASVRINDDDTTDPDRQRYAGWPRLYMGDVWATESVDSTITFSITLYPTSRSTITVDYRTVDKSAKAGVNYRSKSGTVTFAPREKHKTVVVDIMDDGQGPGTEFQLVANGPHGGGSHPGDYWVTGRIHDESPTFRSWDESARESGNGSETQMNFYVSIHHAADDETYTIDYATVDGTARAGTDYTHTSGTFTFAPGDKGWKLVTVPILDDSVDDSGEQFSLVLSNPTGGAQLNRWHHTVKGTILNEDAPGVSASFPRSTHTSSSHTGASDTPKVVVAFSEAVATFAKTTPSVLVDGATITSVEAHTETGLQNAYIFTLEPDGENDITFTLKSNEDCTSGGICTSASIKLIETPADLTITGPKPPPVVSQLSVSNTAATEEEDSTIDFVVTLNPASAETVTVNFATANGTATAGADYTAQNGTLTFNAGETSKTVQVSIIDDDFDDNHETLTLTLSSASGAQISDSQATGVISNQETDPLTARYINMPEEHDGSAAFSYAVEFSRDVQVTPEHMRDHSFTVTNGDVTAASTISGLKYLWEITVQPDSNSDVTITLAGHRDCSTAGAICKGEDPRQLSHNLTTTVTGPDSTDQSSSDEGSADEGSSREESTASQLSVADATASEEDDSTIDFVVQLNPASTETVTVDYATANGTATSGDDYTARSGTLTFAAGDTTKTVQVSIIDDNVDDDNETLTLTLNNASGAEISDSEATGTIRNTEANTPAAGLPTISGTPQVEQTLTADTSGISDEDGLDNVSYRYQWTAGGSDIAGATGSSHTLTYGEQGKTVQVRVTFTDDADNEETLTSAATVAVAAAPNREATGAPTIGGTPQVEQTLTADTANIDDADGLTNVSYGYQWTAGGSDIDGATGASFTLTASEQGKTIQVKVTFTDDRNNAETLTSIATAAVAAAPAPLTASLPDSRFQSARHKGADDRPQVIVAFSLPVASFEKTTPSVSLTGAAVRSVRRHEEDGLKNAWIFFLDPDGNDDIMFSLTTGQPCASGGICTEDGGMLSGGVQATLPGPDEEGEPENPTPDDPNSPATGAPTISGTPQVEQTLTANTSSLSDQDGLSNVSYAYQWLAAGAAISGATGSTYTLTANEEGDTIQVRVSFNDDKGNAESRTSVATDAVAAKPAPLTASFSNVPASHSGSAEFTFTLTFSENLELSYRTLRDHAFTEDGGTIEQAQRKVQGSNQTWTIKVQPAGNGAITITLPATTDCDDDGAICTGDGRKLSNSNSVSISGPQ